MLLMGQARQSGKPTERLSKDRHKEAEMHAAVSWTIWGCGQVKASLRILREFSGAWELGENVTIWLEGLFHMSLLRIVQLREKSRATLTSQAASHFASHFWHKYYSPYEWGNWGLMRLHNLSGVSLREVTVQGHCPRHDTLSGQEHNLRLSGVSEVTDTPRILIWFENQNIAMCLVNMYNYCVSLWLSP